MYDHAEIEPVWDIELNYDYTSTWGVEKQNN